MDRDCRDMIWGVGGFGERKGGGKIRGVGEGKTYFHFLGFAF